MKEFLFRNTGQDCLSSPQQLRKDFGDFPPYPLQCKSMIQSKFTIIYFSRIKKYLYDVKFKMELLRYIFSSPNEEFALFLLEEGDIKNPFEPFKNQKDEFLREWNTLGFIVRVFFVAVVVATSPFLVLVLFFFTMFSFSRELFRVADNRDEFERLGGFHSSFPSYSEYVNVNAKYIGNSERSAEIITHEHIHLLQCKASSLAKDFRQISKYIRAPNLILRDDCCDRFTLYLLTKIEVEARLHEVILSYYCKYRELPLTLQAFFDALVLNRGLHQFLVFGSNRLHFIEDWENSSALYRTRSSQFGGDLEFLITSMKDIQMTIKFAMEVLAVMYANLLRYYGDEEASLSFGRQIQRPNLYDRLYLNRQKTDA